MIGIMPGAAGTGDSMRRLRILWALLAALCGSVVVAAVITMAQHRGAPGKSLLVLSGGFVVLAALASGMALGLNAARLGRLRGWIRPLRGLIAPLVLAALFVLGLFLRASFVYAHAALAAAAGAMLILATLGPESAPRGSTRWWAMAGIVVVLAALGARAYALSRYPDIDIIDEPWNLSWSATYLQTGHVSEFTMAGNPGDPTYYTTAYIPRWAIPVAEWLRLVGIGLWQGRLLSLLVTIPVIVFTALAARNLYGSLTGVITALTMFASMVLVIGLRLRHDIGVALALALALWLYSEAIRRNRAPLHLLAGLALGSGGFAHYHAFGFGPAVGVALYLPRFIAAWRAGRRWPERGAWLYAFGLALGLGLVALIQIVPDVQTFVVNRAPRNPTTLSEYLYYVGRFVSQLTLISWYEALLVAAGVAAALWRRTRADVTLVLLLGLGHTVLPLMTHQVRDHYLVPLTPIYALLIGSLLGATLTGPKASNRLVALVAGLCFVMPLFGQTLKTPVRDVLARKPIITPTPDVDQWVLDHVPTQYTIMGENADYLWLHDYRYYALWLLDFVPSGLLETYPSREEFLLSLKPDVIVFHPDVSTYGVLRPMLDDPAYLPSRGYRRMAEFPGAQGTALVYVRDGVVTR